MSCRKAKKIKEGKGKLKGPLLEDKPFWVTLPGIRLCPQCRITVEDKQKEENQRERRGWEARWEKDRLEDKEEKERLRSMPYAEYLKTNHWQRLRRKALGRADYRCQMCSREDLLDVHHRSYEHRGVAWREIHDLIALCRPCHEKHHDILPSPDDPIPLEDPDWDDPPEDYEGEEEQA